MKKNHIVNRQIEGTVLSVNLFNNPVSFNIDVKNKNDNIYHVKWPGQKIIKGIYPSGQIKIKGSCVQNDNTFISPNYELL